MSFSNFIDRMQALNNKAVSGDIQYFPFGEEANKLLDDLEEFGKTAPKEEYLELLYTFQDMLNNADICFGIKKEGK